MRKLTTIGLLAAMLLSLAACGDRSAAPLDAQAHRQEVLEWRAERLERLLSPMGYLTQTGLFWLDQGTCSFGADSENDVVFPGPGAAVIGEFVVTADGVRMMVAPEVDVRHQGEPVTELLLSDDTTIEGLGFNTSSPGVLAFEIDGQSYALEAHDAGEDGGTLLDFNKAYSPPCAFNDFSTCPVASPRNRLPVRIEAGEKYDKALHYAGDASG